MNPLVVDTVFTLVASRSIRALVWSILLPHNNFRKVLFSSHFLKVSIALALKKLPPKGNVAGGGSGLLARLWISREHHHTRVVGSERVGMKEDRLGIISSHHFLPWSGSIQKLTRSEKPSFKPSEIPRDFLGSQRCQELDWKRWKPREDWSSHLSCSLWVLYGARCFTNVFVVD